MQPNRQAIMRKGFRSAVRELLEVRGISIRKYADVLSDACDKIKKSENSAEIRNILNALIPKEHNKILRHYAQALLTVAGGRGILERGHAEEIEECLKQAKKKKGTSTEDTSLD